MTSNNCAKIQRLPVGVCLPTDWGHVLPRWALGPPMMARCGVADALGCHFYPSCAWELLLNQRPKPLPRIGSGVFLLYFPL